MNLITGCQPFYTDALCRKRTAKLCAALVFFKGHLRFFHVAINLPAAYTFAALCLVFDKTADILRGITQKQSYLMGKFLVFTKPFYKLNNAVIYISTAVAAALKKLVSLYILQILFKL